MNAVELAQRYVMLGSSIEVIEGQPQYEGLQGTLVHESKNMFWLSSEGVTRLVPKSPNTFLVDRSFVFSGDLLVGRFFDRLVK
ncbi:MAG TPA: ribonuclease P protein subunit [Conexivisphaerales archaeon]|nr:ribonuclease P protein subunit [Conexivisphaerales archaeon]